MCGKIKISKSLIISKAVFFCLFFAVSCNNSLDPLDREQGFYSIYGVLNLYEDINFVRVNDLNTPLIADSTDSIDATVILQDLDRALSETLRDSTVVFDGVVTHNFLVTTNLKGNTRYRVKVEGADGRTTTIDTQSPFIAEKKVEFFDFEDPEDACDKRVVVTFQPVMAESRIEATIVYKLENRPFFRDVPRSRFERQGNMVSFDFFPFSLVSCSNLSTDIFTIQYTHFGPDFLESTTSDSIRIPGGTGMIGALYEDTFSFSIPGADTLISQQ